MLRQQFFGVTFLATNQSDRKRCDWCNTIVDVNKCYAHVADRHSQVRPEHVRIEPGMTV